MLQNTRHKKLQLTGSILSTILAVSFLLFNKIIVDDSGLREILNYKAGYWLWLTSSLVMLLGNLTIYFIESIESEEETNDSVYPEPDDEFDGEENTYAEEDEEPWFREDDDISSEEETDNDFSDFEEFEDEEENNTVDEEEGEDYLEEEEYIGTKMMNDLADKLGVDVIDNKIDYNGKIINFYHFPDTRLKYYLR